MKIIKNIVYILFFSLVLFIIALNILSMYDLSLFGFRTFRIMSGSMNPNVLEDSFILIKECDEYKIGDIVTYKNNEEYITHRIIKIDGEQIITRGDSNNTQDENISENMIIGKVVFSFALYGFIIYLLTQPVSWILLFIIVITIIYLKHLINKNAIANESDRQSDIDTEDESDGQPKDDIVNENNEQANDDSDDKNDEELNTN